jgi:hypothetical protein
MRVLPQPAPLTREPVLLLPDALDDVRELAVRAGHRLRLAVAILGGPFPPRRAAVNRAQRLEARVVVEPVSRRFDEVTVRGRIGTRVVGRLVAVDERRIASEVRAHPVR